MSTIEELTAIAEGRADRETLARVEAGFPYFATPIVWSIRSENDASRRQALKMRLAACVADRDTLALVLGEEPEEFAAFYPDEQTRRLSTDDTIDSFLDRFGDSLEAHAEGVLVPVQPPAVDYASMLERELPTMPAEDPDSTAEAIGSFLKGSPAGHAGEAVGSRTEETPKSPESPALTESLARIMIKNHNYSKALEIIEALSLNNPEKSIYFADQIRFLRKLIKIESIKQ